MILEKTRIWKQKGYELKCLLLGSPAAAQNTLWTEPNAGLRGECGNKMNIPTQLGN